MKNKGWLNIEKNIKYGKEKPLHKKRLVNIFFIWSAEVKKTFLLDE